MGPLVSFPFPWSETDTNTGTGMTLLDFLVAGDNIVDGLKYVDSFFGGGRGSKVGSVGGGP